MTKKRYACENFRPGELKQAIDEVQKELGINRSAVLKFLVRLGLAEHAKKAEVVNEINALREKHGITLQDLT